MNYDYDCVLVRNKRWNERIKSASALVETYCTLLYCTVLYCTVLYSYMYTYIYCILHLPLSIDILHCDKKVVKLLSRDPIHLNGFEPCETELTELNKVTEIL